MCPSEKLIEQLIFMSKTLFQIPRNKKALGCFEASVLETFSNEDRNANNDGSGKLHFWLAFSFFGRVMRVLFSLP